jgi:hypothetical protein
MDLIISVCFPATPRQWMNWRRLAGICECRSAASRPFGYFILDILSQGFRNVAAPLLGAQVASADSTPAFLTLAAFLSRAASITSAPADADRRGGRRPALVDPANQYPGSGTTN